MNVNFSIVFKGQIATKANLPYHLLADLGFILGLHRDDTTTVLLTTFMTWTLEG